MAYFHSLAKIRLRIVIGKYTEIKLNDNITEWKSTGRNVFITNQKKNSVSVPDENEISVHFELGLENTQVTEELSILYFKSSLLDSGENDVAYINRIFNP